MCHCNYHCVSVIELLPVIVAVLSYLYHCVSHCFCIVFTALSRLSLSLLLCDLHCITVLMHFCCCHLSLSDCYWSCHAIAAILLWRFCCVILSVVLLLAWHCHLCCGVVVVTMPFHDIFCGLSLHPAPAITDHGQLLYPQMTNEVDRSSVQQAVLSQRLQRPILPLLLPSWLFLHPWKLSSFSEFESIRIGSRLWISAVARCVSTQQDKPHSMDHNWHYPVTTSLHQNLVSARFKSNTSMDICYRPSQ